MLCPSRAPLRLRPFVTGVVALMLQANPELGWRDVKEILSLSARHVGARDHLAPAQISMKASSTTGSSTATPTGTAAAGTSPRTTVSARSTRGRRYDWPDLDQAKHQRKRISRPPDRRRPHRRPAQRNRRRELVHVRGERSNDRRDRHLRARFEPHPRRRSPHLDDFAKRHDGRPAAGRDRSGYRHQ